MQTQEPAAVTGLRHAQQSIDQPQRSLGRRESFTDGAVEDEGSLVGKSGETCGPQVIVGNEEQMIFDDVTPHERQSVGAGCVTNVPCYDGLVPGPPAEPAGAPVEVDVLVVGEKALVEWAGGSGADVSKHGGAVQGRGGRHAKDLAGLLPLSQIRTVLSP